MTVGKQNQILFKQSKNILLKFNQFDIRYGQRSLWRIVELLIKKIGFQLSHKTILSMLEKRIQQAINLSHEAKQNITSKQQFINFFQKIFQFFVEQNNILQSKIYQLLIDEGYVSCVDQFLRLNRYQAPCFDYIKSTKKQNQNNKYNQNQQKNQFQMKTSNFKSRKAYQSKRILKDIVNAQTSYKYRDSKEDEQQQQEQQSQKAISIQNISQKQIQKDQIDIQFEQLISSVYNNLQYKKYKQSFSQGDNFIKNKQIQNIINQIYSKNNQIIISRNNSLQVTKKNIQNQAIHKVKRHKKKYSLIPFAFTIKMRQCSQNNKMLREFQQSIKQNISKISNISPRESNLDIFKLKNQILCKKQIKNRYSQNTHNENYKEYQNIKKKQTKQRLSDFTMRSNLHHDKIKQTPLKQFSQSKIYKQQKRQQIFHKLKQSNKFQKYKQIRNKSNNCVQNTEKINSKLLMIAATKYINRQSQNEKVNQYIQNFNFTDDSINKKNKLFKNPSNNKKNIKSTQNFVYYSKYQIYDRKNRRFL